MFVRKLFFVCALATASLACASPTEEEEAGQTEDAVTRLDSIDRPTDTGITLLAGRWHDNVLKPTEGWHAYHFTATETGYVRFVMKAPVGHAKMWSYLRIEHEDPSGAKPWLHNTAGVGNTRTNLCEIIMKVQAGAKYTVVTTSQHNLTNPNSRRHISDGPYTVAVLPLDATLRVPE
ncbi:MAG: hypothetical protein JST00_03720 [Deltaproteobacteria bacterium]|nr:hypothetical protein [Deltaproteobacteria bacterium]